MTYFLYGLFFVSCIVLVAAVLLQPGKTDAGALFTSNVSNTNYQPRGAQSVLAKITIGAATVFMLSALLISLPAFSGNVSVLQSAGEEQPALGTNANVANTQVQTETNTANTDAAANTAANTAAEDKPAEEEKPAADEKSSATDTGTNK